MDKAVTPPDNHIMVLDGQGWVGLNNHMGNETTIVNAARVSFNKQVDKLEESDVKLIKYLLDHKHMTPFEHVQFTFSIYCPLFIRSQWHRHRTWAYSEISRRYTSEDIDFYVPTNLRIQAEKNKQASVDGSSVADENVYKDMIKLHHKDSVDLYNRLLEEGVCREQARGVLPQNMMTAFWGTVDLRNLIGFLILRDDPHAQYEIRVYADAIKDLIRPIVPEVLKIYNW